MRGRTADYLIDAAPEVCRLFIPDGAKALKKAVRNRFGKHRPIQPCQVHKSRNILDRLPKGFYAPTKKALRQAWEHAGKQIMRAGMNERAPQGARTKELDVRDGADLRFWLPTQNSEEAMNSG